MYLWNRRRSCFLPLVKFFFFSIKVLPTDSKDPGEESIKKELRGNPLSFNGSGKPFKGATQLEDMAWYLLVLGCSRKKDTSPYSMKALDRYDGVNFNVLKKMQRERTLPDNMDIVIISAKYGFLKADTPIDNYDMRMTPQRAQELRPSIIENMKLLISEKKYQEIFINLGKDYLPAIEGLEDIVTCPLVYARGRIGEKMRDMKKWIKRRGFQSEYQQTLTDLIGQEPE